MYSFLFFQKREVTIKLKKKKINYKLLNYIKIIMMRAAAQNSSLLLNWKTQAKLLKDDTLTLCHKSSPKLSNRCSLGVLKS